MFPKIGVPQNGWFIMEHPIKMDDLGYHYIWKHPYEMQRFHCTKCSAIFSANAKITSSSTQLGIKEHNLEAPERASTTHTCNHHIWNPGMASRFKNLSTSESTTHQEPTGFGISPVRMHSSQLPYNTFEHLHLTLTLLL